MGGRQYLSRSGNHHTPRTYKDTSYVSGRFSMAEPISLLMAYLNWSGGHMDHEREELLDTLERPKAPSAFMGQSLFGREERGFNTADLSWTYFPAHLYAIGYKDAADGLKFAISNRRTSLDSAIYPLVYLYRHGLELQLKLLLPIAGRVAQAKVTSDLLRHELMPMWRELRRLLRVIDPAMDETELMAMESFIKELHEVDPGSFAFRYSTNKKGDVSLPGLQHINVEHLAEVLDSVFMMLGGIHDWLGEMDGAQEFY